MSKGKFISSMVLLLSIVMLPSCKNWFNKTKEEVSCPSCPSEKQTTIPDGSPVLVSVAGKPRLTAKEFEDFINKSAEGNEQVKLWMQFLPDFKEQVFAAKKRSIVIGEWAKKEGIQNTKEYRDKEKMIMDSIRESLDTEEFLKRHDVEATDEDARKFYDENKTQDPRILISAAGINSSGVLFDDQGSADNFAESLKKNKGKDLDKLAKAQDKTVTKFGSVNNDSVIDSKLRDKILATKTFPAIFTEKDEKGKVWVVVAKSKDNAQYRPFEQLKDPLKKMLKPKKLEEMFEKELPKLEKDFNITVDKAYFEEQKKHQEQEAQQAADAMAQMLKNTQDKEKKADTKRPSPVVSVKAA